MSLIGYPAPHEQIPPSELRRLVPRAGVGGRAAPGPASPERFPPAELLRLVRRAEEAGFGAAKGSDHFRPWGPQQGHSGFAWSWLGAALATTRFSVGSITAPGYRYHPAIVA